MTDERPVLGAAFDLAGLETHRDWLLERQRDLELQAFVDAGVLEGGWRELAAEVQALLRGHTGRLGLHGPFWGFKLDSHDPDVQAVIRGRLDRALDVAAALGATQLVVHSPFTTWDHHNLGARSGAREALIARVHGSLGPAVRRAEGLGVELVVENIEDMDPRDRVELVRSFESDAVRVSLDTGHANYAHRATGGPPVDVHIHVAGDLLTHVHLQDTDGFADRHWMPGEGDIPWPSIFAALESLASRPRLILELADATKVPAAARRLDAQGLAV